MERKLIRLANKTLVVSLPYEWVEKVGLKKGNSVELLEKDREIVVKPTAFSIDKERIIDIRKMPDRPIKTRILQAIYKTGFRNVTLICNEKQARIIEDSLHEFIGLILLERKGNRLFMRNMIDSKTTDFFRIFRKTFLILNFIASESLEAIKTGDKKRVDETINNKENFQKHANLCMSLLSSGGFNSINETNIYFYMLSNMGNINDFYIRTCNSLSDQKNAPTHAKSILLLYSKVNKLLSQTQSVFFSGGDINEVYKTREEVFNLEIKSENVATTLLKVIAKLSLEIIECKLMLDLLKV
jgi:phosphate uptake regulator